MQHDTRNVIDEFRNMPIEDIVAQLDARDNGLHIAIENLERDFNMGTIVRNANAFGVRHVHVIGRKQWNKRGAMMTDKYLHVHYYATVEDFITKMATQSRTVYAIDNIEGSVPMHAVSFVKNAVLVFGNESNGVSDELAAYAERIVAIEQFGSTRSVNVGVAAGIAMYCWCQQNVLS